MIRRVGVVLVALVPVVLACNALGLDMHDPAGPAVLRSPVYVTPSGVEVDGAGGGDAGLGAALAPSLIAGEGAVPPAAPSPVSVAVDRPPPVVDQRAGEVADPSGLGAVSPSPAPSQVAVRGRAQQLTDTIPPATVAVAQSAPAPVSGDCDSWRPLLAEHGIPFDVFRPIMWRESRCSNAHNWNPGTRDDSFGVVQVNRFGSLGAAWDAAGFSREYMATPAGGVAAAALLFHACGLGPWTKPYGCPGGWPL